MANVQNGYTCNNEIIRTVHQRKRDQNFPKIFRFPITSIFGHMHEALNVDKK
jgi:hypothetical protein